MPVCYAKAAADLLTNPALDPFGRILEFKFRAVRAEPAEVRNAAEQAALKPRLLIDRLAIDQ